MTERDPVLEAVRDFARRSERDMVDHPTPEDLLCLGRGELPRDRADEVEEHLALCRDCSQLLAAAPMLSAASEAPAPAGDVDAAWRRMRSALEQEDVLEPPRNEARSPWWMNLALAAAMTFAVVAGLLAWRADQQLGVERALRPNIPVIDVQPRSAERSASPIGLSTRSRDADRAVLILQPTAAQREGTYALSFRNTSEQLVERIEGLRPTKFGNFTLEISAARLPAGTYELELSRIEEGGEEVIDVFLLTLSDAAAPGD